MKVLRKMELNIDDKNEFKIGDQIKVGNYYTATCQKVGKKGAIFMFDQYLNQPQPMNYKLTNKEGYESSDLRKYLQHFVTVPVFDEFRELMVPFKNGDLLRIPTAEEIFGPEEAHKKYENLSNKKQWELMKDRHNRIAFRGENQTSEWGWLQNRLEDSATHFALVSITGHEAYGSASDAFGVRVVFRLKGGNK